MDLLNNKHTDKFELTVYSSLRLQERLIIYPSYYITKDEVKELNFYSGDADKNRNILILLAKIKMILNNNIPDNDRFGLYEGINTDSISEQTALDYLQHHSIDYNDYWDVYNAYCIAEPTPIDNGIKTPKTPLSKEDFKNTLEGMRNE